MVQILCKPGQQIACTILDDGLMKTQKVKKADYFQLHVVHERKHPVQTITSVGKQEEEH